jgi:hypothetical protein
MTKRLTNTEFVTQLMDFSPKGVMMQLVVLEALRQYPVHILENKEEFTKSMKGGFISPEAWIATCEELQTQLKARFAPAPKKDAVKTG